ncbi:MAG: hypothetical protein WCE81_07465 [Halobacteriota archaeon]
MDFNAFLVGVDREACALYKKVLDKHLPGHSQVVYSQVQNDSAELKSCYLNEDGENLSAKHSLERMKCRRFSLSQKNCSRGF